MWAVELGMLRAEVDGKAEEVCVHGLLLLLFQSGFFRLLLMLRLMLRLLLLRRLLLFLVCGFGGADAAVVGLVGFWFGGGFC
jgi:hypothetical protein